MTLALRPHRAEERFPFLCLLDLALDLGDVRHRRVSAKPLQVAHQAKKERLVLRLLHAADRGREVDDDAADAEVTGKPLPGDVEVQLLNSVLQRGNGAAIGKRERLVAEERGGKLEEVRLA